MYLSSGDGAFKSIDNGENWAQMRTNPPRDPVSFLTIDPRDPSILYAQIYREGLYKSIDGGNSWVNINNNLVNEQTCGYALNICIKTIDISPLNSNKLYIGTREAGVYKSDNGGETWEKIISVNLSEFLV